MKISLASFVSTTGTLTRFVPELWNTTSGKTSGPNAGDVDKGLALFDVGSIRPPPNRSVVISRVSDALDEPGKRSRRNKSTALFVSLVVTFELWLANTIIVPYRETKGCVEAVLPPPTRD